MASRNINDLHPNLQRPCRELVELCAEKGIDVIVTCTYRDGAEQDRLYALGRTQPGKVVTNARAGQSKHNFVMGGHPAAKAFDVAIVRDGKCVWDTKDMAWQAVGAIGEALGLTWAGHWAGRLREYPHFEMEV